MFHSNYKSEIQVRQFGKLPVQHLFFKMYPNLFIKMIAGIVLFAGLSTNKCFGQQESLIDTNFETTNFAHYNMDYYKDTIVQDDYYETFCSRRDLQNFRKLRQYRFEKSTLLEMLEKEIKKRSNAQDGLITCQNDSALLSRFLHMKKPEADSIPFSDMGSESNSFFDLAKRYGGFGLLQSKNDAVSIDEINKILVMVRRDAQGYYTKLGELQSFRDNYKVTNASLMHVNDAIDYALAPEYQQQGFREEISTVFSVLIGILLVVFFGLIYLKGDKNIGRELLGGTGLQFISLFILIISITLFGILGILGGSELAAILSGISGYVLGKGVYGFGGDKSQSTSTVQEKSPAIEKI